MARPHSSEIEVMEEGFRVLAEGLGTSGALRFLLKFERGEGDYTRDRGKMLSGATVEGIVARIKKGKRVERPRKNRHSGDCPPRA